MEIIPSVGDMRYESFLDKSKQDIESSGLVLERSLFISSKPLLASLQVHFVNSQYHKMGKKSKSKTPREMQDNIAVGVGGSFLGPLQTDPEAIETARGRQLHFIAYILCKYLVLDLVVGLKDYMHIFIRGWMIVDQHDYLISTPMLDGNLSYNDLLDATVLLFQKLYPNEEFFPKTPSPKNLEDDIPINLED
ncbi:unnamed protein product [Prunus brigantina]